MNNISREEQAKRNRERWPELAEFYDEVCRVFGDGTRITKLEFDEDRQETGKGAASKGTGS